MRPFKGTASTNPCIRHPVVVKWRQMAYESIDQLQKELAETVFKHTGDQKKAAGRALGTLVEIVTFYMLKDWGLGNSIAIERGLEEYKNPEITHNVEYSLHPLMFVERLAVGRNDTPITPAKIFRYFQVGQTSLQGFEKKCTMLLSADGILRNSCVLGWAGDVALVGLVRLLNDQTLELDLVGQYRTPYAMFECKRVGVEEGQKKGPQTIEKAKQGAYVARTVSALQKIRTHSGELHGVIPKRDGSLYAKPYATLIDEVVHCNDPELLRFFIMTVGVVSNHGNWFTSDNPNKEMRVLAQSYDWLLFLTDKGLVQFVNAIFNDPIMQPAREAFTTSYAEDKRRNRFTKVQMDLKADKVLQEYFKRHRVKIESWFNVISPKNFTIEKLKEQIAVLAAKDWKTIVKS
jgi:hypothetical protein